MGYYTRYGLTITPRPDLERIGSLGRARRALERESLALTEEIRQFFAEPINEAIYQALFNEQLVFALGRSLLGGEPDSQWRSCDEDMRKLSAAAPDHLFTLSGQGEEPSDRWFKYFKGGRMQEVLARIVFDEFDERKLA
jgi:hypothetical protein